MDAAQASISPQQASLFPFIVFVFAFVLWIVAVVIVLPRLLGHAVSFFVNRAFGEKLHLLIHAIYIYPLAGRAVAHSVQYTVPNGIVAVEQLVLQVRWWRKAPVEDFNQLLTVDQPAALDRVAHAQQELQKENTAFFLKRPVYRLRRWWRRVAGISDLNDSTEPSALISIHCLGLRTRMVNYQSNYDLLTRVMEVSKSASRHASFVNNGVRSRDTRSLASGSAGPATSHPSMVDKSPSSSASSFSSVQSVEEKPLIEHLLELTSLRITHGAFYFCDMGQSPLVRLSVQSAKLRYMYGAPSCPIDKSRKRIRMRMSCLKLSVADKATVRNVSNSNPEHDSAAGANSEDHACVEQNNTNRMIQRVLSRGYKGISEPMREAPDRKESALHSIGKRSQRSGLKENVMSPKIWALGRKARRTRPLPCSDVLNAETAIVDYVFDEPGVERVSRDHFPARQASGGTEENLELRDDSNTNPPPVCRVSIVLKGTSFSYDVQAIADIERVLERLQPPFYDLVPVAKRLFSGEGKRTATGIQITIDASPISSEDASNSDTLIAEPLLSIPFDARERTWKALQLLNIRHWNSSAPPGKNESKSTKSCFPVRSKLMVRASKVSLRTEIPYEYGASQKTLITFKDVDVHVEGVADMPIGRSKLVNLTRVVQTPQIWNDEHHVSYDVLTSQTDLNLFPDTFRVLDDISASVRVHSKKPDSVRYFVPYRERTTIRAEDQFCISLTCSQDNAWRDIQNGTSDQYGVLKLHGTNAELDLIQVAPSSYINNSSELHWSLSLPNLSGKLSMDLSQMLTSMQKTETKSDVTNEKSNGAPYLQKSRTTSLAQRMLIQLETFVAHHPNTSRETTSEEIRKIVEHTIFSMGEKCEWSGKLISHDGMVFLEGPRHAFLDSVNRSEMRLTASSLVLDLNPHHTTSILNLSRNYACGGNHAISSREKSWIEERRRATSMRILEAGRYPDALECLTMGLSSGLVMSSAGTHKAADDVFEMHLQIDSLLLRVHALPHALSPFSSGHKNVCSLLSRNFGGSLISNRLGSEMTLSPKTNRKQVSIFGGYLPSAFVAIKGDDFFRKEEHCLPRAVLTEFRLSKRTAASPFWGSYNSELGLDVDAVKGCIMDYSLICLSSFTTNAIPHSLFEDQTAIASMLSVDTIQIRVNSCDFFVLSPASSAAARRSGQRTPPLRNRAERGPIEQLLQRAVPKFLQAITHMSLGTGMRFVTSSLATERQASRTRFLVPEFNFEIMIPWDEKLPPWIDEATMRAQVSHASPLGEETSSKVFKSIGVLKKVGVCRRVMLDIFMEFSPSIWSSRIKYLQEGHVTALFDQFGKRIPRWATNTLSATSAGSFDRKSTNVARQEWWVFLSEIRKDSISKSLRKDRSRPLARVETMSVSLPNPIILKISPSCVEVANDIVTRMQEGLSRYKHITENADESQRALHDVDGLLALWTHYESATLSPIPEYVLLYANQTCSMKVFETAKLSIHILPPVAVESSETDKFSISGTGSTSLIVSVPLGLQFAYTKILKTSDFHRNEIPSQSDLGSRTKSNFFSIKTSTHVSLRSIVLQCCRQVTDEEEIGIAQGITFLFRENITGNGGKYGANYSIFREKKKSDTLVCKLESFNLGSKNSSLSAYTAFGKVASVFLLMLRTLALNCSSLQKVQTEALETICNRCFSTTLATLCQRRPLDVYLLFVNERRFKPEHKDLPIKNVGTEFTVRKQPPGFKVKSIGVEGIRSMDLAFRNISMKISGQELLQVNVFLCKTGSSVRPGDIGAKSPHELVIKAAFGTIRVFMTESIAAHSLRMVSEVASFVGGVSKFFPMLRIDPEHNDDVDGDKMKLTTSTKVINKHNEDAPNSPNGYSISYFGPAGSPPANVERNAFRWSPISYQRSIHFRNRSKHQFQHKPLANVIKNLNQPSSSSFSLRSSGVPRMAVNQASSATRTLSEYDRKPDSSALLGQSLAFSEGYNLKNAAKGDSFGMHSTGRLKAQNNEVEALMRSEESDIYQVIAERTAGETGPPRKRAKRMIPKTVVPPAFERPNMRRDESPVRKFSQPVHDQVKLRSTAFPDRKGREQGMPKKNGRRTQSFRSLDESHRKRVSLISKPTPLIFHGTFPNITMFLSVRKVEMQYTRRRGMPGKVKPSEKQARDAGVFFIVKQPRLTLMSSPNGMCSIVLTASSSDLRSSNDPNCTMAGSISRFGMTVSIAQDIFPQSPPKLILSARISGFIATLQARDLQSVLKFREEFKEDLKGVLTAFVSTKHSISEMARATRLMSTSLGRRALFSTLAIDLLFEDSKVILEGFHPQDTSMSVTYLLDGLFFSAVASEADKAALTLGLRLYGHGLRLAAPAWSSDEVLNFPSVDARGVQWVESIGVPTLLKVTAEPLRNSTSVQGLRHILFTVSGLMAFQNLPSNVLEARVHDSARISNQDPDEPFHEDYDPVPGTPLTRSFAAWERTKGVRMELSIRPMSLSLASGPIVALFHLQTVTGTFEWNKLVEKGIQLRTATNAPRISLSLMRMPSAEFTVDEIKPEDERTSLSIALERSRVDVLKSQEDLQHTFIFRVEVHSVSGKLHPWRLLRDAATWADEQEFLSDLQVVNYNSLSSNRQRLPKSVTPSKPTEHRVILVGFNVQRFKLAVPLLSSEEYSSSRLALSATDLHLFARQRFENPNISVRNVLEVKFDFVGVFWENSSLLSSHHARFVLAINHNSQEGHSLFGPTSLVIIPGTWMIHPRKDFVMAIIEAKTMKEYKNFSEKLISRPDTSGPGSSVGGDSLSNLTERQDRLLFESLRLKITRTSGFIEGLGDIQENVLVKRSRLSEADLWSKLSIPAFSIAVARDVSHDFDLVDVDFSGREGEFPRSCLQRVSNLFAELFGAVVGEQEANQSNLYLNNAPSQNAGRKVSRDVSVLVRFGESLYRAQEEAKMSFESKFGFFAGPHSAFLLSVATSPIFGEEETHTTVYTGISPDLKLEITPLLEGAKPQSLRLSNARMLHGISPCFGPHSVLHVPQVVALMEAKTVLLAERRHRLRTRSMAVSSTYADESPNSIVPTFEKSERNALVVLGGAKVTDETTARDRSALRTQQQTKQIKLEDDVSGKTVRDEFSIGPENKVDPDIRFQLKLQATPHAKASQMDVFVHRFFFGLNRSSPTSNTSMPPSVASFAVLHQGMVRARWDFLSCNLSLRENIMYGMTSKENALDRNWTSVGNIMNRLKFDILRYETHTLRLDIDALAINCLAQPYSVVFESTDIRTEVSHTLLQAIARLLGLIKKLGNEVKLLSERDIVKGSKRAGSMDRTFRSTVVSTIQKQDESLNGAKDDNQIEVNANLSPEAFAQVLRVSSKSLLLPNGSNISVKGRTLVLVLRGYQFEERRHNATISLSRYDLFQQHWVATDNASSVEKQKKLKLNFDVMKLSYNDDERQVLSDLCKIPDPALVLRIWDISESLKVDLQGHLDIKLGSGFYNWRQFRDLTLLTLHGVEGGSDSQNSANRTEEPLSARDNGYWNNRIPEVTVNLNPRIDVIGDFTSDVLFRMQNRLGNGEDIPGYMYHHVVLPLEALVKVLCDPLVRQTM